MTPLLAATTQQRLGIAVVVLLVLGWLAYVFTQLKRTPAPPGAEMELAPNRRPYLDDEQMEGRRLSNVLLWALVLLAITAVGLPLYWVREPGRQEGAERGFDLRAVQRGESLSLPTDSPEHGAHFGCQECHGPGGVGGVTTYTMTDELGRQRQVQWAAPALDTVLLRHTDEEVRRVIVYGRPNTPMPAWGADGGGPMNEQQVDDLVAWIEHIQRDPDEVKAENLEQFGTDGLRLFQEFCARCHTRGWSFGEPDVMGGGAFGPSLLDGVTLRQFPSARDHFDFITEGSEFEEPYGIRGVGSGRMPGFGRMLTDEQIQAIVDYERSL